MNSVSVGLLIAVLFVNLAFSAMVLHVVRGSRCRLRVQQRGEGMPRLSIVVPARNEARQIEQCVRSLLTQDYPGFEVIVVDDCSSDETAAIVEAIAAEDTRVCLLRGEALPEGWVGKPWALAQGARVATGSWLLFTDADTVHAPSAAGSALQAALRDDLAFLSVLTEQVCVSWSERAILPAILLTIALGVGTLDDINNPRKRDVALFNGQYILARRDAYDVLGGHEAVKGEIAEDYELARLIKRDGRFRSKLVTSDLVRVRMYRKFSEIWSGFTKNLALGVRGKPLLAAAGLVFFAMLAPGSEIALVVSLWLGHWGAALAIAAATIAAMTCAEAGMQRFGLPRGSGFRLPVGMTVMVTAFAASLAMHATGGVAWRGRHYAGRR